MIFIPADLSICCDKCPLISFEVVGGLEVFFCEILDYLFPLSLSLTHTHTIAIYTLSHIQIKSQY